MVAHAFQKVSWYRRVHALNDIGKITDVRKMLKGKDTQEIPSKAGDELFSEEFDKNVELTRKAGKNILTAVKPKPSPKEKDNGKRGEKSAASSKKRSASNDQTFSFGPSPGGGGAPSSRADRYKNPYLPRHQDDDRRYGSSSNSSREVISDQFQLPLVKMLPHPEWLSSLWSVHPPLQGLFPITRVESPLAGRIQKRGGS